MGVEINTTGDSRLNDCPGNSLIILLLHAWACEVVNTVNKIRTCKGRMIWLLVGNPLRCHTDSMKRGKRLEYRNVLVALLLNHLGKEETGRVEQLWRVSKCNLFVGSNLCEDLFTWSGPEGLFTWRGPEYLFTWTGPEGLFTWTGPEDLFTWRGPEGLFTWTGPEDLFTCTCRGPVYI